jgi:homocysteine S-methyltransferase
MPLWSASALLTHPEVVKEIHRDYIDAGADVITTNTFRTNERTFKKAGRSREEARDATLLAVRLAREAREESGRKNVAIGGSVGPVEDCYSPALVPSNEELIREHTTFAEQLKEGGVDFIAIETMNTIREAAIAAEAARKAGLPFTVSFVCDDEGNLLSGEPIEDAVKALVPLGPMALGTNCRPLRKIEKSVDRLLASSPVPVMVYANGGGEPDHATGGWTSEQGDAEGDYVRHTEAWLAKGVKIVGGCCGTTPDYTQRMKKFFPED